MSVARITEISSTSNESFEDAIKQGVERAAETLHGMRSAWVKEQEVELNDGKISAYKVSRLVFTFAISMASTASAPEPDIPTLSPTRLQLKHN